MDASLLGAPSGRRSRSGRSDDGSVLILTILLTVVLAAIVLALATFTIAGLKSSDVTDRRLADEISATNAVNWAVEEFAKKTLTMEQCADGPVQIAVPEQLVPGVTVTCEETVLSADGHPQIRLIAVVEASTGADRELEAVIEVPAMTYEALVRSWIIE